MYYYFGYSPLIFIILNLLNLSLLKRNTNYNNLSIGFTLTSITFGIINIIILNIKYHNLIFKEFYDSLIDLQWYIGTVFELNTLFASISLSITIFLFILSLKLDFKLFYTINISLVIIIGIYLFFSKGIIITKSVVDMSLLSNSIMIYYLNITSIPLILKKYQSHILKKST